MVWIPVASRPSNNKYSGGGGGRQLEIMGWAKEGRLVRPKDSGCSGDTRPVTLHQKVVGVAQLHSKLHPTLLHLFGEPSQLPPKKGVWPSRLGSVSLVHDVPLLRLMSSRSSGGTCLRFSPNKSYSPAAASSKSGNANPEPWRHPPSLR